MSRPDDSSAVYIDDRVKIERWVRRNSVDQPGLLADEPPELKQNVVTLLSVCKQIYLCHSAKSFATAIAELNERSTTDGKSVFAFFDIENSRESASSRRRKNRDSTTGSGQTSIGPLSRGFTFSAESEDSYGIQLLALLTSDLQLQEGPKLIIPVALVRPYEQPAAKPSVEESEPDECPPDDDLSVSLPEPSLCARCLDAGAVDILIQPLEKSRVDGLLVHAYRVRKAAQKEISRFMSVKKTRKRSWVGVHDEQPYAYLREAMVSKLMKSICNPEDMIDEFQDRLDVLDERKLLVERKIGDWDFSAHDFSDDELAYAAQKMLEHALTMPEVGYFRLTPGELQTFVLATRTAYNSFVLYHNFRHAVDVLQSVFSILLHIGALPPYDPSPLPPVSKSPIASLLSPFDVLVLLISALGHDVGHPGVNNVFLVKLNAPLAQLYNDSSVLEAFHCAAFSQILRRHWPAAFRSTSFRKLLISTILATDMGVHFQYMSRMAELQQKYRDDGDIDRWSNQDLEKYSSLVCGLIIKCADISNVARPWQIAEKWTNILQKEFANQGEMEKEVGMETALFGGPPELGNVLKLATGQISFMSIFALPLFEGVADLLPQMAFAVQQIQSNRTIWQDLADRERRKSLLPEPESDVARSPRSFSPVAARSQDEPRVEGTGEQLPASSPQENDAGPTNVKITFDQPPDQKHLSITTVCAKPSDTADQLPRITSVPDMRVHNAESTRKSYSSGHVSVPSSSHGAGRDTRTQSASTCSNTVTTPVSPATNATSFVTVDSGDEREPTVYGLSSSDLVATENENPSRPTSSGLYAMMDRQRYEAPNNGLYFQQRFHASHRIEDFGKKHHVMTAVVGRHISSRGSSPVDHEPKPGNCVRFDPQPTFVPKALRKRKSRLRLAFWRRKESNLQQQA
ncbi:hypothetical protein VTN96DRAFT_1478 [Rasamsonia emersonii]